MRMESSTPTIKTPLASIRRPSQPGIAAALLGAMLLFAACARAEDSTNALILRIEQAQPASGRDLGPLTLSEVMEKYHVPGVSIALIKDFKIQWSKAYGVADVVTGAPVNTETLFQAASIS